MLHHILLINVIEGKKSGFKIQKIDETRNCFYSIYNQTIYQIRSTKKFVRI